MPERIGSGLPPGRQVSGRDDDRASPRTGSTRGSSADDGGLPVRASSTGPAAPRTSLDVAARPTVPVASPPVLRVSTVADAGALARTAANERFTQIEALGARMHMGDIDVRRGVLSHALSVGLGAGFAFGAGRAMGAGMAEALVHLAFQSPQLLGVGDDEVTYDHGDRHHKEVMATVLARWVGATLGGGVGAAVGKVLAPRAAGAVAARQLLPVPPKELVPDHVAHLFDRDGQAFGDAGVATLRAAIANEQAGLTMISGDTHVQAGKPAFAVLNAVRYAGQGLQPMGLLPDAGVSFVMSGTAGAITGLDAAARVVAARKQVPDPRSDAGATAWIDVPLFQVGPPAPIPDRFSGRTAVRTATNVVVGVADRAVAMAQSTAMLGLMQTGGTAVAAALPTTSGDWAHRIIQSVAAGGGVWAAVRPWFTAQPVIAKHDKDRREPAGGQRAQVTAPGRGSASPRASAPDPAGGYVLAEIEPLSPLRPPDFTV